MLQTVLTSSTKRPRLISMQSSFAELIVYYLPEEEQKWGYILNADPNHSPGSKISILDSYHYQQLLNCQEYIDRELLKSAWKEWKELGTYEHGELFRQTLYNTTKPLNIYIRLQEEIKLGMDGSRSDIGKFYLEWHKKGMREAKSDKDWIMWKEVVKMTKDFPEPVGCHRENCKHYGECLGRKMYR